MLNLPDLIDRGIKKGNGGRPILAAPFDLAPPVYKSFFSSGKIAGVIVNSDNPAVSNSDKSRLGHWVDRQACLLTIENPDSNQMLFLGVIHQVGGRMLFELRRKGISELICLSDDGVEFQTVQVREKLNEKFVQLARKKFISLPFAGGLFKKRLEIKGIEFESAYKDLREYGHFLALPNKAFHKNKILIMSGSLGPGGAERQIYYTARGLKQFSKCDVAVACDHLEPPGDFFKAGIEEAGVRVMRIPIEGPEFVDPRIIELRQRLEKYNSLGFSNVVHHVIAAALILKRERPSLVHIWMDASSVCAGMAAQIVGVPHIVLGGRSVAPDNFEIHQPYMLPGYLNILKHGTPMMLNNSRAGAKDYTRWLGIEDGRIKVVCNGMEFPPRPEAQQIADFRKSHAISEKAKVVGGILRFSEEKRPQLWIDTVAEVVRARPDTMAIGFGGGIMLEQMRNYVKRLGLENRILLPGLTDKAWLAAASMDIFLMTSRKEGLPNVLLEAQGMGVPIVCTATGGMAETYIEGETGISVPEATPQALAHECLKLLGNNKRLHLMGRRAYEHVREKYNIERMIADTCSAYNAITGDSLSVKSN